MLAKVTPRSNARSSAAKNAGLKPRYYGKGSSENPDAIDIHVGARIRLRRSVLGLSQDNLAEALGITFQQIQKYERGTNRVSASRLYQLSQLLDVAPNFFFEGFNEKAPTRAYGLSDNRQEDFRWLEDGEGDLMERKETIELVRTYYQVQDEATRRNFVKMLRSLVAAQGLKD
ncbi:MAG: helix-turn-helix transcriptional regulator [Micavibrio aeruginosavorus]|nr:helix-turn-helix transcriptional regulator [Micavibrio aeruginosavorus]